MANNQHTTTKTQQASPSQSRNYLAYIVLSVSVIALTVLAWKAISVDNKSAENIFNIVLPVVASWVGTVLAFYFGKENFESANVQVRELMQKMTPAERAKALVADVMRDFSDMVYLRIPEGKNDVDIEIKDMRSRFDERVTRLPIIYSDNSPKYMVHASSIDRYLASGGTDADSLEKFISSQKIAGYEFGLNKGFILVPEATTLKTAKDLLEQARSCQDIFITKYGKDSEPLSGWISNIRLTKFLDGESIHQKS